MLRSTAIDCLHAALARVARLKARRYPDMIRVIESMSGATATGVGIADYLALYEHVLYARPRYILELGAGLSSAVIAAATVAADYQPRFVAVEENPEWTAHHRVIIAPELLERIELIERRAEATANGAHYINLPILPYDFVHVDGPATPDVTCDIIELSPHLASRCRIIFDGREASARHARPHLEAAGFRLRRGPLTLSHEFWR